MPERWETQIRKLRKVEPGPDLGVRFEEGPRGEQAPATRQRVAAAVTALALFVAAGAFAVRVFGTGAEPVPPVAAGDEASLVLELSSEDSDPAATLRYGDQVLEGQREEYEWCEGIDCVGGIVEFARYPPVFELIVVPPSTRIEVLGDGSVERIRTSTFDDETVDGSPMRVPESNGTYVVEIEATWAGHPGGSANFFFGVQTLDSPASAPDVLGVECGPGYTVTDAAVVRTQADGLHVEVSGAEGIVAYSVIGGTDDPEAAIVGSSVPAGGGDVIAIPPGEWEFACRESGEQDDTDPTASFELVDPDGNYASPELACDDATERAFTSSVPGSTAHEDAAAQLVTGLGEGDRLRGAGYGADTFKVGPTYVVERGGDSVARLTLGAGSDPWAGSFGACDGSGIGLSELATPTALEPTGQSSAELSPPPGSVPDVLIVRCEGLGPAVESTQVRLRADGLHVDALNVADAEVVEVTQSLPDRGVFTHRTAFEEAEESFVVVGIEPGTIWVGCRVTDENGEILGGPDEVPDAYVQVEVLPA